jgi:hypothetical protein
MQGCEIFLATTYQNGEIITNGHKIDQIARPLKIYPNWEFWFGNKPSGKWQPHVIKTIKGLVRRKILRFLTKNIAYSCNNEY